MTVDAQGNIYITNYDGVHKSSDNGSHWTHIGGVSNARGLAFNSSGDLFLASWGGGAWRLLNGDTLWLNITSSLYPYIDCLFIGSNDYIYAAKNRSTDNGNTWTSMTIPVNNISSFAENSLGHLFIGTYNFGNGVWRSTDYGDTWEEMNNGLTIMDVRSVAIDSNDYLYAGTNGESLFKTTTSTLTNIINSKIQPSSFGLEQNYPNPFNPTTTIKFDLPKATEVSLKVFNVLGEEVTTLVSDRLSTGLYSYEWDASNLASGVYLYRLRAGDYVETRKMVLMR
jgi:hypothetical protein